MGICPHSNIGALWKHTYTHIHPESPFACVEQITFFFFHIAASRGIAFRACLCALYDGAMQFRAENTRVVWDYWLFLFPIWRVLADIIRVRAARVLCVSLRVCVCVCMFLERVYMWPGFLFRGSSAAGELGDTYSTHMTRWRRRRWELHDGFLGAAAIFLLALRVCVWMVRTENIVARVHNGMSRRYVIKWNGCGRFSDPSHSAAPHAIKSIYSSLIRRCKGPWT